MDFAKIIARYTETKTQAEAIGVTIEPNEAEDKILISGMGASQDKSREFTTIQELMNFVDGFTLGYQHPHSDS